MAKSKPTDAVSPDQVFEEIAGLVDAFCKEHLNEEYADLCRRLTEKLARKRPSPLVSGKPNTWACGIVRTIGWVNFLDDKSQTPHMKLTAIDKAFGIKMPLEQWTQEVNDGKVSTEEYFVLGNLCKHIDQLVAAKPA